MIYFRFIGRCLFKTIDYLSHLHKCSIYEIIHNLYMSKIKSIFVNELTK